MFALSEHFTLEEMVFSATGTRLGILNKPAQLQINCLGLLCREVLEPLRALAGCPLVVISGYRSRLLNRAVGGQPASQHLAGQAADVRPGVWEVPLAAVWRALVKSLIPWDQAIWEYGRWIHVSYDSRGGRRSLLRAYVANGRTVYTRLDLESALALSWEVEVPGGTQ